MEQVGLGLELVKQFIEKNYFVCNIDRNSEKMKTLNNTYKDNYKGFVGDIADSVFVKDVINEISNLGNIKILINNAGEPSFKIPTKYEKEAIDAIKYMQQYQTETDKLEAKTAEKGCPQKCYDTISAFANKQEKLDLLLQE